MAAMNDTYVPKWISFTGGGALDRIHALNIEDARKADYLLEVAQDISDYYIWPIFVIGLPANLLALVTILTLPRLDPESFLVALLSVLDALALIAKLTGHQVIRNQAYLGSIGCKFQFLVFFVTTMANWVLLLICADRFVSICFPLKKALIFTNKKCYIIVSILAIIFLVIFGTISGVMRSSDFSGLRCSTYNQYIWFWVHVWYWINASLILFIPVIGIIPMTAWTVWTLRSQSRIRSNTSTKETSSEAETAMVSHQHPTELEKEEGAFTLIIILAAVFFVVLALPACVYYLMYHTIDDHPLTKARWAIFQQIQFVLFDSSHAINFFLYFLSCKYFRDQFLRLLACKVCKKRSFSPQQITTATDSEP